MPLTEIDLALDAPPAVPERVAGLIATAEAEIDSLFDTEQNRRTPKFLPSDPRLFHAALAEVKSRALADGDLFCEWGCGFGLAAGIASLLGFEAYGIEIEPALVRHARALNDRAATGAEIIESSYVPYGFESFTGFGGEELVGGGDPGDGTPTSYDELPHPIADIDVFYVYPWPGEQEFMLDLFGALAGDGALLLAYYGERDLCAYRKEV